LKIEKGRKNIYGGRRPYDSHEAVPRYGYGLLQDIGKESQDAVKRRMGFLKKRPPGTKKKNKSPGRKESCT